MSKMPTTIAELQALLDPLPARMSAKGLRLPSVRAGLSANKSPELYAVYVGRPDSSYADKHHWFKGRDLGQMIEAANEWIDSLPTVEEARLNEFREMLAKTIELGKNAGLDDVLVNPLAEAMKRLSENAITDQRLKRAA